MIDIILIILSSFFTGIFASLGLGGGFILILYLTIVLNMDQILAQGYNLLFFIPISLFSCILYFKDNLIEKRILLPSISGGIIGSIIGIFLAKLLTSSLLSKFFAVFILIIGIKELFSKSEKIIK